MNRLSLLYTWPGEDPSLQPVALLAHMDVVPVQATTLGQWTHPPFAGVVADGAVWGRGAIDMKSTMVSLMEAAEHMTRRGVRPARTVYLAFGHDEEVSGGAGATAIAHTLGERGVQLAWVLDEGGGVYEGALPGVDAPMALISVAEKGYLTLAIEARAQGGHSSMPPAETAVGRLSAAIVALEAAPFPSAITDVIGEMIERIGSVSSFGVRLVTANRWLFDPLLTWLVGFDPTFAAMTRTTTAPTMLEASPQENVLAQTATAKVNFRLMPGDTVESVVARVEDVVGSEHVSVRLSGEGTAASRVAPVDGWGFLALERSIGRVFPDALVVPGMLMAGTDSRHYADVADHLYRFAGMRVDRSFASLAHGTDERIPIATLAPMVQVHVDLLEHGLGAP